MQNQAENWECTSCRALGLLKKPESPNPKPKARIIIPSIVFLFIAVPGRRDSVGLVGEDIAMLMVRMVFLLFLLQLSLVGRW